MKRIRFTVIKGKVAYRYDGVWFYPVYSTDGFTYYVRPWFGMFDPNPINWNEL